MAENPTESEETNEATASQPASVLPQFPVAMPPIYATPTVNAPINLYSGKLELRASGHSTIGDGTIKFVWTPDPDIRFEIAADPVKSLFAMLRPSDEQTLVLPNGDQVRCVTTRISTNVSGFVRGPLLAFGETVASEIIFHLVNCSDVHGSFVGVGTGKFIAARIGLESHGWSILIDRVPNFSELYEELEAGGGYAITHVGRIWRTDDSTFDTSAAKDVLDCLYYMLSFAHGIWIPSILHVARDATGQVVREEWPNIFASRYQRPMSWFPRGGNTEILPSLFPRFLARWQQPLWKETIRRAVWWYVSSNEQGGSVDNATVFLQVALELLAWVVFVEEGKVLSRDGFEKLKAPDKLRLLVNWMKVPLQIPAELHDLVQFARTHKWTNGPWVFVEARNAVVHPRNRNILIGAHQALFDVWQLGMWYLELALLHACDYRGKYANRFRAKWRGQAEDVPWKTLTPPSP